MSDRPHKHELAHPFPSPEVPPTSSSSSRSQVPAHRASVEAQLQADVDQGGALGSEIQGLRAMLCRKAVRASSRWLGPLTPELTHRTGMNAEAVSHLQRRLAALSKRLDSLAGIW